MKGQSSIEFLILLAFSLAAFASVVFFASSRTQFLGQAASQELVQDALDETAAAAESVFLQGEGAVAFVDLRLPPPQAEGIAEGGSRIENNSLVFLAGKTQFSKALSFPVQGTLPSMPGRNPVRLSSSGGIVSITPICIVPQQMRFFEKISQASSRKEQLVLKNNSSRNAFITLSRTLGSEAVGISFSKPEFDLNSGLSETIDVLFSADPRASGNYSGKIAANVSGNGCTDYFEIPAGINVSGTGVLAVFPSIVSGTYGSGSFHSIQLSICNNSQETISGIFSERSSGAPGEWFSETALIESLPPGCAERTVEFSVPSNASGHYSGFLTFSDSSNLASVDLNFTVD